MFPSTKDDNVRNLKASAQDLQNNAGAVAMDAQDDLRHAANRAGHKVREFIHTAGDEISHAKETVTSQIRTNPVQSSMIALGVGFILGALFRR